MHVDRHFMDWTRPALAAAVADLMERCVSGADDLDLSDLLVVLPGGRAMRRMLELLVSTCEGRGLRLVPPRLMTVGHLPEHLYPGRRPVASPLLRRLLWTEALRGAEAETLRAIVPTLPDESDTAAWASLGQMVERLHGELAAARIGFGDVAALAEAALGDFADQERFAALAAIGDGYLGRLDRLGVEDPHRSRLRALEEEACRFDGRIVLVAVNWLPPVTRAMLEQTEANVTALVHAPAERADGFDELGCLDAAAWADVHLPVADEQIHVVRRPVDQATAVLQALAALEGRYAAEQVTVGVCDESLTPYLQQHLPAHHVPVRDAAGTPMGRTGPYRLLATIADYLDQQRFGDFAVLVRHPDLAQHLLEHTGQGRGARGDDAAGPRSSLDAWLELLDRYFNEHLQGRVTAYWLGDGEIRRGMRGVYQAVHDDELLGPLTGAKRAVGEWAEPILQVLRTVYARGPLSRDDAGERLTIEACRRLQSVLNDLSGIPASLSAAQEEPDRDAPSDTDTPPGSQARTVGQGTSASEAVRLVLRQVAGEAIPPEPAEAAVELLGPLELHLDDAPVLLVTGVNEGKLPESLNADAFLPNTLRAALGLEDNERRYARDAYALTAMVHSRRHVRLIAGRRNASGDPLAPSRLLFAAPPNVIVERVARLYGEEGEAVGGEVSGSLPGAALRAGGRTGFVLPPPLPEPLRTFDSMAVTEFRLYLQCPYRYYLERGLRLSAMDDAAAELDALRFGTLAHDILRDFGHSDARDALDPLVIASTLRDLLHEQVRRRFGSSPLPAVHVQVQQLENRLRQFAYQQAEWAQEGWRIRYVEQDVRDGEAAVIEVDGEPMPLRGRIDRIDEHEVTGAWAVLDYKTGDKARSPDATHRTGRGRAKRWVDLQLPLYRHLLPAVDAGLLHAGTVAGEGRSEAAGEGPDVSLGYIVLPRDPRATAFVLAGWSDEDLAHADETARTVVRDIRAGNFAYDPGRPAPRFDPYATLCGIGQSVEDDDEDREE